VQREREGRRAARVQRGVKGEEWCNGRDVQRDGGEQRRRRRRGARGHDRHVLGGETHRARARGMVGVPVPAERERHEERRDEEERARPQDRTVKPARHDERRL
jgi:hypothetical protein